MKYKYLLLFMLLYSCFPDGDCKKAAKDKVYILTIKDEPIYLGETINEVKEKRETFWDRDEPPPGIVLDTSVSYFRAKYPGDRTYLSYDSIRNVDTIIRYDEKFKFCDSLLIEYDISFGKRSPDYGLSVKSLQDIIFKELKFDEIKMITDTVWHEEYLHAKGCYFIFGNSMRKHNYNRKEIETPVFYMNYSYFYY